MSTKRKSKTKRRIVIGIITIAVVSIVAALILRPVPVSYESATAKVGDITTYYSFSGNVETKNRQTVTAEKVMQISDIQVADGELVEEGTVLFKTTFGDSIKSKISGEIASLNVEENAQVMAGAKLLEVVDYSNLEINVKVDESDIAALATGKDTIVRVGAINKDIKGKISSMSKEGQVSNGLTFFLATIDLEKDDSLKIGMSAEVKVISNTATGVVTLPMTAIQFDDSNKPYVLKKDAKGNAIKTQITTGINDGTTVEIKNGVLNGEVILFTKAVASGSMGFGAGGSRGTSSTSSTSNTSSTSGGGNDD